MSTADGAILAMGTVFSHNVVRQFDPIVPGLVTNENLLNVARITTVPFTLAATLIASQQSGQTGYLLIVAFDVVLATVVVPLFGCFYTKTPRPNAAFLSVLGGAIMRTILEFTLPKDGFLILPFDLPEFYDYGPAASFNVPTFVDAPKNETWDPSEESCDQAQFEDYTGVDSLGAFVFSFIIFVSVQALEHYKGSPLFELPFGLGVGYNKDYGSPPADDTTKRTTKEVNEAGNDSGEEKGAPSSDSPEEVDAEA